MEQYDGIVFTGGECAPLEEIKNLCSDGLFTVCADSGWEAAAQAGVRVDRFVGDFDSLRLPLPSHAEVCRYSKPAAVQSCCLAAEAGEWIIGQRCVRFLLDLRSGGGGKRSVKAFLKLSAEKHGARMRLRRPLLCRCSR